MAGGSSVAFLRDIETLFDTGTASGLTDRQLLDRFASRRDAAAEAAFEVLVLRHGPMVLRVCQNLLRDPNDAHDAFQATFLVMVRRCGSIRKFDSVGGWLYGVACRVAARARVDAARRRRAEERAALRIVEAVDPTDVDDTDIAGFGPTVQDEVRRLPEKYRAVVVLCYWQGLTHEQAAGQLRCPLGTVRSRIARARNLLRRRLIRRGLAPLAAFVAAGLDGMPASASAVAMRLSAVPPQWVHSTIQAAIRVAGGQPTAQAVSGVAASLVQHVLWSMTMIKIKMALVVLALVGLAGSSAGFALRNGRRAEAQVGRSKKTARAENDSAANFDKIYSPIKGQTTIVMLVPDGSIVKKGQLVCELDSAALKDQLVNQQITVKSAEANFENAKLTRETADYDQTAYTEDLFPREQRENEGEIKVAESELALGKEQFDALRAVGGANKLDVMRAELVIARANLALEKARNRLHFLTDYTKGKQLKGLQSAVEKARSEELAKKAVWELENSKAAGLERQIAACNIKASRDGTLIYANPFSGQRYIEEGATVRERQLMFQIIPPPETNAGVR
jgi:HlyD family secretion protein